MKSRGQVVRDRMGRLELTARATDKIKAAIAAGKRFLSVEFVSLVENKTAGGVREIERALRGRRGACRLHRSTSGTGVEVRAAAGDLERSARLWL